MNKMKNKEIGGHRNQNEKGAAVRHRGDHVIEIPEHLQRRAHGGVQEEMRSKKAKDV